MELGKQIKRLRNDFEMSQDTLAERVFVSRQTISNWENDKSYPDVNSLLLLSEVFAVSIDQLIKGDIKEMKEQIKAEDREQFKKVSRIFTVLFVAIIVLPVPLIWFLGYAGMGVYAALFVVTMYFAMEVEKKKKQYDIQTYREIIAFDEGKSLDEISKAKEEGKRPYQKLLLTVAAGVITLIFSILMMILLGVFS